MLDPLKTGWDEHLSDVLCNAFQLEKQKKQLVKIKILTNQMSAACILTNSLSSDYISADYISTNSISAAVESSFRCELTTTADQTSGSDLASFKIQKITSLEN